MKFLESKLYCKYVISEICEKIDILRKQNFFDSDLEDTLFESYKKLEFILNGEFDNI